MEWNIICYLKTSRYSCIYYLKSYRVRRWTSIIGSNRQFVLLAIAFKSLLQGNNSGPRNFEQISIASDKLIINIRVCAFVLIRGCHLDYLGVCGGILGHNCLVGKVHKHWRIVIEIKNGNVHNDVSQPENYIFFYIYFLDHFGLMLYLIDIKY